MADSTGDPKNGDMGPMGPKCNPLKQAVPANAREYYTAKVLGVSNQKTKSPTCSSSIEPTDMTHTLDEDTNTYKHCDATGTTTSNWRQHREANHTDLYHTTYNRDNPACQAHQTPIDKLCQQS